MLSTTIITTGAELQALAPEWRGLLSRMDRATPVTTPTWALAWWEQFGEADGRKLRAVAVRDGAGELVALALLSLRTAWHRGLWPIRRLELLMTGEDEADEICSDYVGVLSEPGREEEAASRIVQSLRAGELGDWDELVMAGMAEGDPAAAALLSALHQAGIEAAAITTSACRFVRLPATWDAYLATLERSHRYVVSRSLRELKAWAGASGYELRRATTPEQLAEGRAVLERLHEQRWNDRGRAGVFASERFARFHDRVMPRLLEGTDGQLELWWLVVAGEPVAAAYNISYRGRVYFYQSGRKLDVPKSAKPGVALHALLLQEAIARGIQEYDFLQGESMYKRQLAPDSRSLITLRAASPALRARLVHSAAALTERGVRMARQKLGPRRPRAQVEAS